MPSATSLNKTILNHATLREHQCGVALLLMLLVVLMIGGTFGLQALNLAAAKGGVQNPNTTKILAQSKEALLAWTQNVDRTSNNVAAGDNWGHRAIRPGALPYPDVYGTNPVTGLPLTTNPIVYDGLHDMGCIRSTWTGTQGLRNPNTAPFTSAATIRCLGKLPWRLLGINLSQNGTADGDGVVPWYAVSGNVVNHFESISAPCPRRFDALIASPSTTGSGCGSSETGTPTLPFPWLIVRDPFGNILSSRVAAVVIVPGPPTARQTGTLTQNNRATATAQPDQFLDTVRNDRCAPTGYCDNARYSTTTLEFIQCVPTSTTLNDSRFTQPYTCNDRLIYITIDELMQAASDRAAREALHCVSALAQAIGRAPYADDGVGPRDATAGLTNGLIPTSDWDETAAISDWLPFCTDFSDLNWDSWQKLFQYSVSPANAAAAGWNSAGTLAIPGKTGNYKVTLRIDVNGTSRWYGIQ